MSDENARQKAEDRYYAALDWMADGKLEEAVAAYRELASDPSTCATRSRMSRRPSSPRPWKL